MILSLVLIAALGALGYAAFSFYMVKKLKEGTPRMQEIAKAIRIGANAFIVYEYKVIIVVAICIAIALAALISWQAAVAFLVGATMSGSAGWVGMKIATYANVRVTNEANESRDLGKTLKVAFRGGSVMGLCVGGFALLGIFIVYLVFGTDLLSLNQITELISGSVAKNWIGLEAPFTMTVSSYALGCSIIALFARVGGGIYTKAADMGADLVGKTEAHIPEDDPRNPATIADNVGDNVGDVAGLGADLLESFVGAIMSGVILAFELFRNEILYKIGTGAISAELLPVFQKLVGEGLILYPILFAAVGLIGCIIGIASLLIKRKLSKDPHKELNMATWISAGVTMVLGFALTYLLFANAEGIEYFGFKLGWVSPWVSAVVGIVAGIVIGIFAEYYTSYDYKPTKILAKASVEGSALTITQGLALGMRSCMAPVIILAFAIFGSYYLCGMYGVACASIGMLSFVAATVSVDSYGPISDNAGGIAEMSYLEPEVREITDKLDSVGNTTAAIGKGFAIGSAALATLSMMSSYLYTFNDMSTPLTLNLIEPLTLAGALIGAALPFMFSGMLIDAVAKAARKMVDEVRRQFREIKGLLQGEVLPDYKTCIEISSQGAIKEMKSPAVIAIAFPVVSGFVFGPEFVGGILIGSTISAIMLAIFTGNAGGAWDNGKKYIETGAIEGHSKGSPAHDAAVVGDTVGDPLKDTVGPSLDILIKIMSTISLVAATVFSQYNLWDWIVGMMK